MQQKNKQKLVEEPSLPAVVNTALQEKISKITRIATSVTLIVIGIVGMVLPFLHGFSFFLAGFIILSFDFPWVDKKLQGYVKKNKAVEKLYNALYGYLKNKFNKNIC